MKHLTRRELALIAAGSVVVPAAVPAMAPAVAQSPSPDWFAQAVESKRKAAADLAAFDLPVSVEPAFEFKP